MRAALIALFVLSGIAVAGGFAAPMVALQVATSISPIFGGRP